MKRQKNTAQMKKQRRNSQSQILKGEISNLPEREFRTMIVEMIQRLENRMEKMQEALNIVNTATKNIEEIKNKQTEMNNTITESKITLKGTNSRITEAEKWTSELENSMVKITAEEPNKGKGMKRLEESLRDLWDY